MMRILKDLTICKSSRFKYKLQLYFFENRSDSSKGVSFIIFLFLEKIL